MRSERRPSGLALPHLSDESAVEILDFLHELVLRFEARYAGQIHRYYQQRSRDALIGPEPPAHTDDPPF
jgi:hypothetical protein